MALNDYTGFEEFSKQLGDKEHDLGSDTWKVALITNATVPTAGDTSPTLSDYTECPQGGGYTTGGAAIANQTFTETGGVATFDGDDITWTSAASSPTDIYYGIVYNSTHASDMAAGFIDFGGPVSMVAGNVGIAFSASGIITITVT
jgi:hypothetical protein